ncbi:MAG: cytochrome c oxidase subunit II [Campylobacterota bacterium]|nr:cytochrome c oxidase subunit II [Campylobacterota bacterium]
MSNKLEGFSSSASTFNADLDFAFWLHIWISVGLFLSVVGPMFYFAWKYRADKVKNEDVGTLTHHTLLEVLWTGIPLALVMVFFYYGNTTMKMFRTMPAESQSIVVNVEASKWKWKYEYPANASGHVHKIGGVYDKENNTMGISALYVPVNTNIILKMTAPLNDVIHSYYVPAFRMKEDVVPGRTTKQWFNATKVGEYDVECAEYCGTDHSYMYSKIVVMEKADYEAWFNSAGKDTPKGNFAKDGKSLYASNGCASCHSIDSDATLVGPSLKGIGAKYDSKYLSDALTNPDKDVPEGFYPGIMPAFNLPAEEMKTLIKYMETGK